MKSNEAIVTNIRRPSRIDVGDDDDDDGCNAVSLFVNSAFAEATL